MSPICEWVSNTISATVHIWASDVTYLNLKLVGHMNAIDSKVRHDSYVHIYIGVMPHIWINHILDINVSHVPCVNELAAPSLQLCTYEWVMWHIWTWNISHIWMRDVTHMNMSHVAQMNAWRGIRMFSHIAHMSAWRDTYTYESCRTCKCVTWHIRIWVMSRRWMRDVT